MGVKLKATVQPIDTGTAVGKAFLDILGVFAEFETNLRKERQLEGIAVAKARGMAKITTARSPAGKARPQSRLSWRASHRLPRRIGVCTESPSRRPNVVTSPTSD